MKKVLAVISLLAVSNVLAADVGYVLVRQQWPWSTDIRVEYRLDNTEGKAVDLSLKAFDGETELDAAAVVAATTGDLWAVKGDGVHTLTIDPLKLFGDAKVSIANFRVQVTATDATKSAEVLYKIFDLRDGSCQDVTRGDFYNGKMGDYVTDYGVFKSSYNNKPFISYLDDTLVWTAVTNDVRYKTTHLVMRLVKAKDQEFNMGSPVGMQGRSDNQVQHPVMLTNDFYIGVFEFTLAQAEMPLVKETDGQLHNINRYELYKSQWDPKNGEVGHMPCWGGVQFTRGLTTQGYVWPDHKHDVNPGGILGRLRALTGNAYVFDLPTEAQWEFACRGGSPYVMYDGIAYSDGGAYYLQGQAPLEWNGSNSGSLYHEVGQKYPNAYGLYDMLGNAWETVLDRYDASYGLTGEELQTVQIDPPGPASDNETFRGGGYLQYAVSATRKAVEGTQIGFRPVFVVP